MFWWDALKGTGATQETLSLLEKPIMDYGKLSAPMGNWYVLFDLVHLKSKLKGMDTKENRMVPELIQYIH